MCACCTVPEELAKSRAGAKRSAFSALDRQLGWDDRKQAQVFFGRIAIGSGVFTWGCLSVRRVETSAAFGVALFRLDGIRNRWKEQKGRKASPIS